MPMSEKQWNALPEEKKERMRKEFKDSLRAIFDTFEAQGISREDIACAIESTIKDLKEEGD